MNDEKIISALLSNPTVKEASKNLNVTPQAIYNRLRDEDFKKRYAKARREVLEQDCYKLQSYLSDAIEEIHDILIDREISNQIRLNACDMLLRHCYRMTELTDVIQRIEKIEEQIGEQND